MEAVSLDPGQWWKLRRVRAGDPYSVFVLSRVCDGLVLVDYNNYPTVIPVFDLICMVTEENLLP